MWPETSHELIRLQRELASRRPSPWRPSDPLRKARREAPRARAAEESGLR